MKRFLTALLSTFLCFSSSFLPVMAEETDEMPMDQEQEVMVPKEESEAVREEDESPDEPLENALNEVVSEEASLEQMEEETEEGSSDEAEMENEASDETEESFHFEGYFVNPVYEGLYSPEDIQNLYPGASSADYVPLDSAQHVYASEEELIQGIQSCIYNRYTAAKLEFLLPTEDLNNIKAITDTAIRTAEDYSRVSLHGYHLGASYSPLGQNRAYGTLQYDFDYFTSSEQEQEFETRVKSLVQSMNLDSLSEYERIEKIYRYIASHVTYDYTHLKDEKYLLKHSAYAALINGTSVCQGYAALFCRMADLAGLNAHYITGIGNGENHGWNSVSINGTYYLLDATWDSNYGDKFSKYEWFLKGTNTFKNHQAAETYSADYSKTDYVKGTSPSESVPESITLKPEADTLFTGSSIQIQADVLPSDSPKRKLSYSSDNKTVAEVDENGKVTAVSPGKANITVTTYNEISAVCEITVISSEFIEVEDILFEGFQAEPSVYLNYGDQSGKKLLYTVLPENATEKRLIWNTFDSVAVTVSDDGIFYAGEPGNAYVSAIPYGKNTSGLNKPVYVYVFGADFGVDKVELGIGENYEFADLRTYPDKAQFTWTSSDPAVATVNDDGVIHGTGDGVCTVTASVIRNNTTFSNSITVKVGTGGRVPVSSVSVSPSSISLSKGNTSDLTATVLPENASVKTVYWSSSNPNVATVDSNGTVKAVGGGSAIITVTTEDGSKTAECTVTVLVSVDSVSLNKTSLTLAKGSSEKLAATIAPEDATDQSVVWESSNPDAVTVDENGTVSAAEGGSAVITVITNDGAKKATCTVTVTVPVSSVNLNKTSLSLMKGDTETLSATVLPEDATNKKVTWSSSNPNVAAVDSNGTVKAVGGGSAIITVTTEDGLKTAECMVDVTVQAESISFSEDDITLAENEEYELRLIIKPAEAKLTDVTYHSDDPETVSVDESGVIQALKTGSAVIQASVDEGRLTASCTVHIVSDKISVRGLEDSYPFTGSAIKPAFQVFDRGVLLTEKTDYTVSYKNNTKAGEALVIVKGKGNYTSQKEKTFKITPVSMDEVSAETLTMVFTGKTLKLNPKASWNGKNLKANTDYTVDLNGWDQISEGEHTIILKGTGNYTGTKEVEVCVAPKSSEVIPVSRLKITAKAVNYQPDLTVDKVKDLSGFTVKNKTELKEEKDFIISDDHGCDQAGTCTFTLTGMDPYYGSRTVSIAIKGTPISKAKPNKNAVYDGTKKTLENSGIDLFVGNIKLGSDEYEVLEDTYENNINAGKATVLVKGLKGYTGIAKITFTIAPDTTSKTVTVLDTVYSKGGAIPVIYAQGLREGADYKVTYKNNKKIGTGTATISFLGNYKGAGSVARNFDISAKELADVSVSAPDVLYKNKKGNYKSKITVLDTDGKKLGSSDYTIVSYTDQNGTVLDKNAIADSGDVITVEIEGKGNYTGSASVTYRVIEAPLDLSKAKITVKSKEYTGSSIQIGKADITSATIKNGKSTVNLNYGTDYEVLCYENNVKKGTAKVTFIGTGDYSGVKTVSFKITQRNVKDHWAKDLLEALGF